MNDKLLQDLKNTRMNRSALKAAPAVLPKPSAQKSEKLSITLFKTDIEKIDAVYALAASNGRRVTTSNIIKLALRNMVVTPNLLNTLDEIRADDGRTK